MHYRGLTWDHPRGYQPLRAAAERFTADTSHEDTLHWDVHSLEGFESAPIERLTDAYDLVVLDHPHLGDAREARALQPVDDVLGNLDASAFIGPSLASYTLDGRVWALPLDAATQVAIFDPSRIDAPPSDWGGVEELSREAPVALSLAGPHAVLTLYAICAAFGEPATTEGELHRDVATDALERMRRITDRMRAEWLGLNPIELHERVSARTDIAYCPLVYGYINYASRPLPPSEGPWSVGFADAPSGVGEPGSVIGGTGLAVASHTQVSAPLAAHLAALIGTESQCGAMVREGGQPSRAEAWYSETVDLASGGFCSATRATLEASWVRPRFPGFTGFQARASALLRSVVLRDTSIADGLDRYESLRAEATAAWILTASPTPPTDHRAHA